MIFLKFLYSSAIMLARFLQLWGPSSDSSNFTDCSDGRDSKTYITLLIKF